MKRQVYFPCYSHELVPIGIVSTIMNQFLYSLWYYYQFRSVAVRAFPRRYCSICILRVLLLRVLVLPRV